MFGKEVPEKTSGGACVMKKTAISWMLKHIRNHIPDLILMVSVDVIHALFWVIFALGTQQVIDSAVSGDQSAFLSAALQQAVICIVLSTTVWNISERKI